MHLASTQKIKNKLMSDQEFIKTGNVLVLSMAMPEHQPSKAERDHQHDQRNHPGPQHKGRHVPWTALLRVVLFYRERHPALEHSFLHPGTNAKAAFLSSTFNVVGLVVSVIGMLALRANLWRQARG